MPIQFKCPSCQKTLRVNDALRGKKIRCPGCQTVVAVEGGVTAARPPAAARKPPASAVATAKRPAPPAADDEEDDSPPRRKQRSLLPILAIAGGVLFLLLVGGAGAVYFFVIRPWMTAADQVKQAAANAVKDADPPPANPFVWPTPDNGGDPKKPDNGSGDPKKPDNGTGGPKKPDNGTGDPKKPDNGDPKPPPDTPKPPTPPAGPTIVQPIAQTIPLDGAPVDILDVLYAAPPNNVAVAVVRVGDKVHLDRYDLAAGRKMDSVETPGDLLASVRDLSPDGATYLCNSGNSTFSVWQLPNAKPVMDKWTIPSSSINAPGGVQTTIIAAYILDSRRFVTVNGGAQIFVWSIADKKELGRYLPSADIAKYPQGLANGGTTAISPDRKKLAVFNGFDGFFVLDTTTLKVVSQVRSPDDAKQPVADTTLAAVASTFSPDGGQLAAMFQWQKFGGKPLPSTLVRWDLQSKQITARFENPTKLPAGFLTKIAWWGPDYCWIYLLDNTGRSDLVSWDRSAAVLKTAAKNGDRPFPGGPDGRYRFMVFGADGKAVLKGLDFSSDVFIQAGLDPGQVLMLTPDGVVKK